MRPIQILLHKMFREESGVDLVEYAVLGVSCVVALVVFAHSITSILQEGF